MSKFNNDKKNDTIINFRIKSDTLRVIDKDKTPLGIMTKDEALTLAKSQDLNKYKYEQQKNEKEMAKKARASRIEVKEVKFKPNICEHDLLIKLKHAQQFLDSGAKVKITVQMRGRENSNSSEVFVKFKNAIETNLIDFRYDSMLALNGNRITGILYKDG